MNLLLVNVVICKNIIVYSACVFGYRFCKYVVWILLWGVGRCFALIWVGSQFGLNCSTVL